MTGVDFQSYAVPFKTYFGQDLPTPNIGFPMEFAAKTAA
jgi:polar amino acid transport system substrate-binding protein